MWPRISTNKSTKFQISIISCITIFFYVTKARKNLADICQSSVHGSPKYIINFVMRPNKTMKFQNAGGYISDQLNFFGTLLWSVTQRELRPGYLKNGELYATLLENKEIVFLIHVINLVELWDANFTNNF